MEVNMIVGTSEGEPEREDRTSRKLYALAAFLTAMAALVTACQGCSPW
jgi:hypothetical protein